MVLKDLGKSMFFNFAEPYYEAHDDVWRSRTELIMLLRAASKQVGRAIDLVGGNFHDFDQEKIDELNGIKMAVEYAADQFEVYKYKIEEVRNTIQDKALQYEIILNSYKQKIGYESDFKYYGAAFKTLLKILEWSKNLQDEEVEGQNKKIKESNYGGHSR